MNSNMSMPFYNYLIFAAVIIPVSLGIFFILIKIRKWRETQNSQIVKLLKLYTDVKLMTKLLGSLKNSVGDTKASFITIMTDIKNYFLLENIMLYQIGSLNHEYYSLNNHEKELVYIYLKENEEEIATKLKTGSLVIQKVRDGRLKCILYIMILSCGAQQQLIAFVGSSDLILESDELDLLGGAIKSILELVIWHSHNANSDIMPKFTI